MKDEDERSRRQTEINGDTVIIIDPTPRLVNESLELAFFVRDDQGQLVNGSDIAQDIMLNESELLATVSIATIVSYIYIASLLIIIAQWVPNIGR